MATERFISLVTGEDPDKGTKLDLDKDSDPELDSNLNVSELDSKPNIANKTKPRPVNRHTSTVAPIVEENLVKIDDDLFKKNIVFYVVLSF